MLPVRKRTCGPGRGSYSDSMDHASTPNQEGIDMSLYIATVMLALAAAFLTTSMLVAQPGPASVSFPVFVRH